MSIRTDIAQESLSSLGTIKGVLQSNEEGEAFIIHRIAVVSDEAADRLQKPKGKYTTLTLKQPLSGTIEYFEDVIEQLAKEISSMLPDGDGPVLVVGLGNRHITPDAVGPLTAESVFATRHLSREASEDEFLSSLRGVSVLSPGVLGQTGIEVSEIIRSVCDKINPTAVIAADALACSGQERLGRVIQLSDTGISPGSGVQNRRSELSAASLGVPVIAIGIPTVIDIHTIAENLFNSVADKSLPNMMVTPRDIDVIVEKSAKLIGNAINRALLPSLSVEEVMSLV